MTESATPALRPKECIMHRTAVLVTILAIGSFTWAMNFALLIPLLKLIAVDVDVSTAAVGQLATVHALATAITALIVTPWMDRVGRGRLLRLGAGLLFAGTVCLALAPSFAWMFPARLIAGVGAAFIMPVCLAAAGDVFKDERKRNQAVGLVIAATALGGVIGMPVLIQLGDAFGWRWTVMALLIPICVTFAGSFGLPARPANREPFALRDYARHYRAVLAVRETNWLLTGHLLRGVTWYGSLLYLGVWATTDYGFDANRLSLFFAMLGAIFFVATNLMPLVTRLIRPRRLYTLSLATLFANYLTAGVVAQEWGIFLFMVVLCVSGAGVVVAESVLLLDSHPAARGGVMSLRSASVEVGTATGAALAALLLVLTNDYSLVYRLLGLLLPLGFAALALSARRRGVAVGDADVAPAGSAS
jgi:MFS transporter, DHA1 family, inner membrane transport protein